METIFFKNGVYVCSEEEFNFEDNDNKVKADASIILSNNKNPNSKLLYGGRVKVSLLNGLLHIAIDGIDVKAFVYNPHTIIKQAFIKQLIYLCKKSRPISTK